MNYQEIEIAGIDGTTQKHIIIEVAPDEFKSFPADESNPEYLAWVEAQATE